MIPLLGAAGGFSANPVSGASGSASGGGIDLGGFGGIQTGGSQGVPTWVLIAAVGIAALFLVMRRR